MAQSNFRIFSQTTDEIEHQRNPNVQFRAGPRFRRIHPVQRVCRVRQSHELAQRDETLFQRQIRRQGLGGQHQGKIACPCFH